MASASDWICEARYESSGWDVGCSEHPWVNNARCSMKEDLLEIEHFFRALERIQTSRLSNGDCSPLATTVATCFGHAT